MKLLITGAAGFIGSNYVNDLVGRDSVWSEIVILDLLTYAGNLKNLEFSLNDERVKFVRGDVRDTKLVNEIMDKVDGVVHFAAESHVDRSIANPEGFVSTNVIGTFTVLQSAYEHEVDFFLNVSTDEVYGSIESGSWNELAPICPNSPYSASKASSDLMALAYWKTFGLPVLISRCSNNFGPFQFPEKFIPLAVTNLIDNSSIPIYGTGLNSRDWLHVLDHCDALNNIIEKGVPGEVYNIGGGTEMSNIDLAMNLIKIFGKDESYLEFVEDRKGHDFRYSVEFDKIVKTCGYSPKRNFLDSIEETVNWYRKNETWWRPLKK